MVAKKAKAQRGCDCTWCLRQRFVYQNPHPTKPEMLRAAALINPTAQFSAEEHYEPLLGPLFSIDESASTWAQEVAAWLKLLVPEVLVEQQSIPEEVLVQLESPGVDTLVWIINNRRSDADDVESITEFIEASEGRYFHTGKPRVKIDGFAARARTDAAIKRFEEGS